MEAMRLPIVALVAAASCLSALLMHADQLSPPIDPSAHPLSSCPNALQVSQNLGAELSAGQEQLEKLAKQFFQYCTSTPELVADKRIVNLTKRWNQHVLLSDFKGDEANVLGSFNKMSGCMYMRFMPDKRLAEQLGILLHELAHSSGWNHDDTWRDAFLFFVNIATEKLGWEIALKCPTVCRSYNICSPAQCQNCDWIDAESCKR